MHASTPERDALSAPSPSDARQYGQAGRNVSANLIYILLLLTMAAWGGTFVAGRLVAMDSAPLTGAFWRFVLAAVVLIPLTLRREGRLVPRGLPFRDGALLALLGLTGMFGYNYFFIKGLGLTEAGRASVIVAINPSMTYLGLALFFKERITPFGALGFSCALAGAAVTVTHGSPWNVFSGQTGLGDVLIFGCVLCWASYSLLGKMALERLSPLMSTTWACIFGLLFLGPAACLESGPLAFLAFSPVTWLSLAFLGTLGTALGFTLYYLGIMRLGAGRAAVFINLVPVFGIVSGWLILNETLDWSLAAGLILVLSGIRLIQRA